MKTLGKLALAASVIAGLGAATVAQAHGIWFAQRSSQLAVIYGVGGEDSDMVKRLPKLKSVTGYDETGKEVPTQFAPNRAAGRGEHREQAGHRRRNSGQRPVEQDARRQVAQQGQGRGARCDDAASTPSSTPSTCAS